MTRKEEEEVGFSNRSFPHWDKLYTNEASVGSLPWYSKDLDDDSERTLEHYEDNKRKIP